MRRNFMNVLTLLSLILFPFTTGNAQVADCYPGLYPSPYFNEQAVTFQYGQDIRIRINMGPAADFDPNKPVELILFALPNGNTIEQTEGKILESGDDWHYDIQHIGAQMRFIRRHDTDRNQVLVYLEAAQKSWPTWTGAHSDYTEILKQLSDYLMSLFRDYDPVLTLSSHSGGGRFIFSWMDAYPVLPDYLKRISFLDSDYGYDTHYGTQLTTWLQASPEHFLTVMAYNDSIALYNGAPIVSATGGTWYRSKWMQRDLAESFSFTSSENDSFFTHFADNGQICVYLKKNPDRIILHTVQVERNGFIESMLWGTDYHDQDYVYYLGRAYSDYIESAVAAPSLPGIPPRSPDMAGASQIISEIENLSFEDREPIIVREISQGNIPNFLRKIKYVSSEGQDASGGSHNFAFWVLPDYLTIGSDDDYCRMPMGPESAQLLADRFGMSLPTPKLVDLIWQKAEMKLDPIFYAPVGSNNEKVAQFVRHNHDIDSARVAGGYDLGMLASGLKKDVVISNRITDPTRPGHVVIYGWHYLTGIAIQPVTNIHIGSYVDYSHGIRLLSGTLLIDIGENTVKNTATNSQNYTIISNESGPMSQAAYNYNGVSAPSAPSGYGMRQNDNGEILLTALPLSSGLSADVELSSDGVNFDPSERITALPAAFSADANGLLYCKYRLTNAIAASPASHVSACRSTGSSASILVVDGFDRGSAGNSYDFIREYASATLDRAFDACSNEALLQGLFSLNDYDEVLLFLGDESTADQTFSSAEQTLYANYLKQGGCLLVSGSEIAWDLDYKGDNQQDKDFIHNYLKAAYKYDAPGNVQASCYSAGAAANPVFSFPSSLTYSNGSVRGINVQWPDVLTPQNGAKSLCVYSGYTESNGTAGVTFEGTFPGGTQPGRLVYLGFPFESIQNESVRGTLMSSILTWFESDLSGMDSPALPEKFAITACYPNPFNSNIEIHFNTGSGQSVDYSIYSLLGQRVRTGQLNTPESGEYALNWNGCDQLNRPVASGLYMFELRQGDRSEIRRLTLLK